VREIKNGVTDFVGFKQAPFQLMRNNITTLEEIDGEEESPKAKKSLADLYWRGKKLVSHQLSN